MSKKKSEFVVGDKVIFKKPVKVFPDRFSSDSVDFAKKGDKGTVVKTSFPNHTYSFCICQQAETSRSSHG
jgi:hypothetical protein